MPMSQLTNLDLLLIDHATTTVSERLLRRHELGKSGWEDEDDCPHEVLDQLLLDAIDDMDYESVVAYAAMLSYRTRSTTV